MTLCFCCLVASETGGETPLVDSRELLRALPGELVERFRRRGITYMQNLHGGTGPGKSWQETFETGDRAEVERFLRSEEADFDWHDGGVRIWFTRPAVATHPVTGEEVWFNQADQWHLSSLDEATRDALREMLEPTDYPQHAEFGDGTEIADEDLDTIRSTAWKLSCSVPWQAGDLLVIDNMLVGHGRRPFTGSRRVVVAMA